MRKKSFTLLEVLITVSIVSTAIIFIFRSFAALLSSARLSQDIFLACNLAEEKIWEIEEKQKNNIPVLPLDEGTEDLGARSFDWSYNITGVEAGISKLDFGVTLPKRSSERQYEARFSTYLPVKN